MTIDTSVNAFTQSIQTPPFVFFSKLIGIIFEPEILIAVSLLIAICLYINKSKKKAGIFALTILIAGLAIKILKEIFQRSRPINSLLPETTLSFPSGHATIAIVFFGLITYLFIKKKRRPAAILIIVPIILLIGLTRIYLSAHWLTDVLGGFVLGGLILALSIFIYKKL